jgi:hypothetical protein
MFPAIQPRQTRRSRAIFQTVHPDMTMDTAANRIRTGIADQTMIDFLSPVMKR